MIDRWRFDNLDAKELEAVAECYDKIECWWLPCSKCPFELAPVEDSRHASVLSCALAYGKVLYRRLTK